MRIPSSGRDWLPPGVDVIALGLVVLGFGLLYLPSYWSLSHTIWATDEQGHGPIILALTAWLLVRRRDALIALSGSPRPVAGGLIGLLGLGLYVVGRSQGILMFEIGSQIAVLTSLLLLFKGWGGVKLALFPLFFLLFMVPLPGAFVAAVTTPLKSLVSTAAAFVLYEFGYPVGRTGVILTIGPYQLLVADACAGLNSMFTLEALGMLYMNLMGYASVTRNILLAILIVPISFAANVIRVMILVLVTYHFGDEAGQGFVHGFAGMVLFLVALTLMLAVDHALRLVFPERPAIRGAEVPAR